MAVPGIHSSGSPLTSAMSPSSILPHGVVFALACAACGGPSAPAASAVAAARAPAPAATRAELAALLTRPHRSAENRDRDRARHPAETLAFFGIAPDMRVVEIWPGRGWYTELLAPLLRDRGHLTAATMDPADRTFRGRFAREYAHFLQAHPEVYGGVERVVLFPPDHFELAPEGSQDMVLTFRSLHNWIRWGGYEQRVFDAMARCLRSGGVLGVVEHRAADGTDPHVTAEQGYVSEEYVIELARHAGLRLDARSQVNANPDDTHDHPDGVWSLPPTLRGGDVDRDVYLAIGESDRMTLRFVKP